MSTLPARNLPPEAVAALPKTAGERFRLVLINLPFIAMHLSVVLVFFAGFSWQALAFCALMYVVRMFAITAGYHRYFSHKAYRTKRWFQFLLALIGTTALQKGPLWWAAHHRHHHRHSDDEHDVHSPTRHGLFWAHMGWIMSQAYDETPWKRIGDFARFPELRWLNRWHVLPFVALCVLVYSTLGFQMLVWGCFVSTVLLWHGTFTINSLCHLIGKRVYDTSDTSRNSLLLALVTLGEGWHNNHHYYPASANQGFRWWQIDISFYILWLLEKLGVVSNLKRAPADVVEGKRGKRNFLLGQEQQEEKRKASGVRSAA